MQHFDGTIEGLDLEIWKDTDLEPAPAPEDWSGSFDIDVEDMQNPENQTGNGWYDPLEFLERTE